MYLFSQNIQFEKIILTLFIISLPAHLFHTIIAIPCPRNYANCTSTKTCVLQNFPCTNQTLLRMYSAIIKQAPTNHVTQRKIASVSIRGVTATQRHGSTLPRVPGCLYRSGWRYILHPEIVDIPLCSMKLLRHSVANETANRYFRQKASLLILTKLGIAIRSEIRPNR